MSHEVEDTRVIAAEAEQYNATLVERVDETSTLAYIKVRPTGSPSRSSPAST
jgi:hypothetical protein